MMKVWWVAGALMAGLAVAAGAFGAHALKARLSPDLLQVFETGVRYQMYHALGLLAVAVACDRWPHCFRSKGMESFGRRQRSSQIPTAVEATSTAIENQLCETSLRLAL